MLVFTGKWCIYFGLIPLAGQRDSQMTGTNLWTPGLTDCLLTNKGLKPSMSPSHSRLSTQQVG